MDVNELLWVKNRKATKDGESPQLWIEAKVISKVRAPAFFTLLFIYMFLFNEERC